MIRARFSPKAGRDLDEHCGHIAVDNPEAAERVRQTILITADFQDWTRFYPPK
jgi:plasmid stabilization system protein ParE